MTCLFYIVCSDVAVKCKLLKWKRGKKGVLFSLYLTLSWLSQHTCSPVRVWRYIMALLLIRVVSSGMEAWHAEKMHLIWITCALFLFPLTVGDPRRRKMTGCLFSYTLDVILIPCAEFMFWSCLLCERSKMGLPCLLFYLAKKVLPYSRADVFLKHI